MVLFVQTPCTRFLHNANPFSWPAIATTFALSLTSAIIHHTQHQFASTSLSLLRPATITPTSVTFCNSNNRTTTVHFYLLIVPDRLQFAAFFNSPPQPTWNSPSFFHHHQFLFTISQFDRQTSSLLFCFVSPNFDCKTPICLSSLLCAACNRPFDLCLPWKSSLRNQWLSWLSQTDESPSPNQSYESRVHSLRFLNFSRVMFRLQPISSRLTSPIFSFWLW